LLGFLQSGYGSAVLGLRQHNVLLIGTGRDRGQVLLRAGQVQFRLRYLRLSLRYYQRVRPALQIRQRRARLGEGRLGVGNVVAGAHKG